MNTKDLSICFYCSEPLEITTGEEVYPSRSDLWDKVFWKCDPCNAHVGCHPGTLTPLGTNAKPTLRKLRRQAHSAFDPFWKESDEKGARRKEYKWLAEQLGLSYVHISQVGPATCTRIIEICYQRRENQGSSLPTKIA